MLSYALISENTVQNVIVWDGETVFPLNPGETLVLIGDATVSPGFLYQNGVFVNPNPPQVEEPTNQIPVTDTGA